MRNLSSVKKNHSRIHKRSYTNGPSAKSFFKTKSSIKLKRLKPVTLKKKYNSESERTTFVSGIKGDSSKVDEADRFIVHNSSLLSKVGAASIPGFSEGVQKINQDSYLVETLEINGEEASIIAVLDGHGVVGHRVSNFLRMNIKSNWL